MKLDEKWYDISSNKYKCPECGKLYTRQGICSHIWRTHGDGKGKSLGGRSKGHVAWNRGLTKDTDERVRRNSESVKSTYNSPDYIPYWKGRKHSDSTIQTMKTNCGGIRKGAGRGKSGYYKGIWCDSTWELAWVIYSIDHGIQFTRNVTAFPYEWKSTTKSYYPDFILDATGEYIEIKGYMTEKDTAKLREFPHPISVITKNLIAPFIEYVTVEYGTCDLITLYDSGTCTSKKRPEKVCPQCGCKYVPLNNRQVTCSPVCRSKWLSEIGRSRSHAYDRASEFQLREDVSNLGFTGTGRKYNVTDNTIRKWCRAYGIDPLAMDRRVRVRHRHTKVCPHCDSAYVTTDRRQKYCSRDCVNKSQLKVTA